MENYFPGEVSLIYPPGKSLNFYIKGKRKKNDIVTRPGINEKTRQTPQLTKWTGSMKSSHSERKRKSLFMRPPLGVAMGPEVPAALEPEERSRNGCKK